MIFRDETVPSFDKQLHYHEEIGCINFLNNGTWPNIAYASLQCMIFSKYTRVPHFDDVEKLVQYLAATKNDEILLYDEKNKSL